MRRRWIAVLAAVFALSLVLAACSDDGDDAGGTETETESPENEPDESQPDENEGGGGGPDLTIVDFSFSPADLTVASGDTITVANIGDTSHTFTTDDEAIDETIGPGEEIQVPIEGVDSQGFHCEFHSQMTGNLTVQ